MCQRSSVPRSDRVRPGRRVISLTPLCFGRREREEAAETPAPSRPSSPNITLSGRSDPQEVPMGRLTSRFVIALWLLAAALVGESRAQAQPADQLTIAFDVSIAPTFLEPAETSGIGTPFVFLYALHDAITKPLPGNNMAPCLAESWTESADGLVYEFKLREGLRFHNGDPFTADDVKFTFHRYRGVSAKLLHERVKAVEVIDAHHVRFVLHTPWPDFLAFYATPAPVRAGSCRRSMSRRSARMASRSIPS